LIFLVGPTCKKIFDYSEKMVNVWWIFNPFLIHFYSFIIHFVFHNYLLCIPLLLLFLIHFLVWCLNLGWIEKCLIFLPAFTTCKKLRKHKFLYGQIMRLPNYLLVISTAPIPYFRFFNSETKFFLTLAADCIMYPTPILSLSFSIA
jgi:hypothetical protein